MKKLTTNSKLIGCLMGLSIVALGTGCTDSDYDLSSVDSTIGVGGEGLELPTSSTENIILDDVLKLNNSDFVKIAANGDYMFGGSKSSTPPYVRNADGTVIGSGVVAANGVFLIDLNPGAQPGAGMTRCSNRLALLLCAAMAMAPVMGGELRGSWQSYWLAHSAAQAGPLAQAHALLPAIAAAPASSGVTLAQVQGSAVWGGLQWHADVVAQAERPEGGPGHSQATVMGGDGNDTLNGGAGADSIIGGAGNDYLVGGTGDDVFYIEGTDFGRDTYNGGDGADMIRLTGDVTVSTLLLTASNVIGTETLSMYGYDIAGTAGNDAFDISGITNVTSYSWIQMGDGLDRFVGHAGGDAVNGGAGGDTLNGRGGDDSLAGGAGNDLLFGETGNDNLDGGDGIDTVSYAHATAGVTVNLGLLGAQNTLGAGTDTLSQIENLRGGSGADWLTGDGNANTLKGELGNDTLCGGLGKDLLIGGAGNDTLISGTGADKLVFVTNSNSGHDVITDFDMNLDRLVFTDALSSNNASWNDAAHKLTFTGEKDGQTYNNSITFQNIESGLTLEDVLKTQQVIG